MTSAITRIQNIVAEHFGPKVQLTGETKFSELHGFDSLDWVELIMAVEDEFTIEITDAEAESPALATFAGLAAFVEGRLAAGEKAA